MTNITISKLISNIPAKHKTLIKMAYDFAIRAHGNQKRASGQAYIIHPLAVAYFLSTLHLDGNTIAAALLHDVLEDTKVHKAELEKEFGKDVAFLVNGVTKLGALTYKGKADIKRRQNIQARNLRKMLLATAKDLRVILIKLADRYHNAQTLKFLTSRDRHRIALETIEIYAPIAERLGMGHLRGEIEDLSFPYAYPKEYQWLLKQTKEPKEARTQYLESLIPKIKMMIENKGIKILDIHSRAKHYYSLYKKILRRDMDINQIYDLISVRVILPNVESCYGTLGLIHTYYKPLMGSIKDYIALPKPNGYQSLHTTVFCEEGKIVEIQLRTSEIHEYAENGIAAHWAYSELGKEGKVETEIQETKWVKKLKGLVRESSSKNLTKDLKLDLFKNRIFVFTPRGDIIDLPDGATPLDAAYEIHTDLGHSTNGAKVNGKMVSLSYELKNGDLVEILKSKQLKPSRDWVRLVKTTNARKKIKAWLSKHPTWAYSVNAMQGNITPYPVSLIIKVKDRIGILKDISAVMAKLKINIKEIKNAPAEKGVQELRFTIDAKDSNQLKKAEKKLKEIKDIITLKRI